MQSLESYIDFSTKGHFAYYLKQSEKHNICMVDPSGYAHQACHIIQKQMFPPKMREKITLLQCTLELSKIMPSISKNIDTNSLMADLCCGRFVYQQDKFEFYNEYLSLNIKELMRQNKIIFIFLDVMDYLVYPYLDGKGYVVHSVILLFLPSENGEYNCHYINSHGQDMAGETSYEVVISRHRTKTYKYSAPAEIVFLEEYIKFLNQMEYENEKIIRINFNRTKKHIYFGADLQAGDYHGVCFTFPLIIWYYFGKYYKSGRGFKSERKNIAFKSGEELIREGNLGLFIESLFMDFCGDYKKMMFKQSTISYVALSPIWLRKRNIKDLQNLIEKKNIYFTKTLLKAFMKFILQPSIKNTVQILASQNI